ncbi:MAG: hypothetical protein JNM07_06435 [Phycisphaerae bacterium]|nr:hypothetical protein [Phycisphaerae bacterium]
MMSLAMAAILACGAPGADAGGASFVVTLDAKASDAPRTGRLIVSVIRADSKVAGQDPLNAPFWEDPQPMYGADVRDLPPEGRVTIDDSASSFPGPASALPPGAYRAAARLDVFRVSSSWRRHDGNLFSDPVEFTVPETGRVEVPLRLIHATRIEPARGVPDTDVVSIDSRILAPVNGRPVSLRASVMKPVGFDPVREYAAIYEVPGFGGDHTGVGTFHPWRARAGSGAEATVELRRRAFYIVLDPESPNGHTLFADSDNNGPRGRALVEELIPAIESRYPLIRKPQARLLRGHSSGGWSTLWLALTYPETFGACWSSSPDPVDFHCFQRANIYDDANFYTDASGRDHPSYRQGDAATMSIRQENSMEECIGAANTSGQQWDSWFATFGPRDASGRPAALFDPATGVIDKTLLDHYRAYDLTARLRADAGRLGPIFKQRVRLLVGDKDNFYLNEAVERLKTEVDKLSFFTLPEGANGYIKILPGLDHGTIFGAKEMRAIHAEMLAHLRRTGLVPEAGAADAPSK